MLCEYSGHVDLLLSERETGSDDGCLRDGLMAVQSLTMQNALNIAIRPFVAENS